MPARSMTGFAESTASSGDFAVEVTMRSVNHRSLDIRLRTPPEIAWLEATIRRRIRDRVRRGGLTVQLKLETSRERTFEVDAQQVRARLDALERIAAICGIPSQPNPHRLLVLPGILQEREPSLDREGVGQLVLEALEQAIGRLDRERIEEGRGLIEDIKGYADAVAAELEGLAKTVPVAARAGEDRVRRRLADLGVAPRVDRERVIQEVAILASRSDASEELQRLRAHVDALRVCIGEGSEMGKRIDFLAQEMNREATTLLSKAQPLGACALPVTESGIRIRAAIGKIREQTMNLE